MIPQRIDRDDESTIDLFSDTKLQQYFVKWKEIWELIKHRITMGM